MTKIFTKLLSIVLLFTIIDVNTTKAQTLNQVAQMANAMCPIKLSDGLNITQINVEDDYLNYYYNLETDVNPTQSTKIIAQNLENTKQNTIKTITGQSNFKTLFQILQGHNGISITFMDNNDESTAIKVKISVQELKQAMEQEVSPEERVQILISSSQGFLPLKLDDEISITSISIIGDDVVYVYTINEDLVTMQEKTKILKDPESRKNIIQNLTTDLVSRRQTEIFVNANKNVVYKYVGNKSNESVELKITNAELLEALNK